MKKGFVMTLLAMAAFVLAVPASAQNYNSGRPERPTYNGGYNNRTAMGNEIYYGLRLGLAFSTVNNSELDKYDGPSSRTGINFGAAVGYQLSPSAPVYLESGLYYTEKGGRNNKKQDIDFNLNYLELPVLVKYCFDIDGDFSVQPFAGGYFAYGIGGKIKWHTDRIIESAFSRDLFKRFDGGLRFGCGAEYQMLYAELSYELGLANIGRDEFEKTHNSSFYLNIGVNF